MPITRATLARTTLTRTVMGTLALVASATTLSGCGSPDITQARIETSLPVVFTNIYLQQQADIGRRTLTPAAIAAKHASCDKGGPSVADVGAGSDWICLMDFTNGAGVPQPKSKFEIKINSNGCYTAGGSTKVVGPLIIPTPAGKYITNKAFEFDGCFDTTS